MNRIDYIVVYVENSLQGQHTTMSCGVLSLFFYDRGDYLLGD